MSRIAQILEQDSSLDAQILLAYVLNVSRSYLHAFPERELTSSEQHQWNHLIEKRNQDMPVAYLIGHREFWSLDLQVTPDTLIPRPETELLVELVLATKQENNRHFVADLGTGSGCIALALAHENPTWQVYAADISQAALEVAKTNAARLRIKNVIFCQGNWCAALPTHLLFDSIISNPPYIAENDRDIDEAVLRYEPRQALISAEEGLYDIRHIAHEARAYLKPEGFLFLEHGFRQGEAVRRIFSEAGYEAVTTHRDLAGLERVTMGRSTLLKHYPFS